MTRVTPHTRRMPPRASRSEFDDDVDDEALFADVTAPLQLPAGLAQLEASGSRASGAGSRTATSGLGAAGISAGARDADAGDEMDWEEEAREDTLIPELIRHWTNERLAPDILHQRGELLQNLLERVREQVRAGGASVRLCADTSAGRACPAAACGPGGERGRALSDHIGADGGRAGPVYHSVLYSDAPGQGLWAARAGPAR